MIIQDVPCSTALLSVGPIDYYDTGGDGPPIVFTHGFPMSGTQWRKVIPRMTGYRCILPTLPLGAHRQAMVPDADLSQRGQVRILAEFLEETGLNDVTLVMNDWGGPQFLVVEGRHERIGRMILVACEAFDNVPPRPVRPLVRVLRMPGGPWLLLQLLRTRFFRHSPMTYGGMSLEGIPDDVLDDWFAPALQDPRVRRDLAKFGSDAPSARWLLDASERLVDFGKPALVVWAGRDRLMPAEHGPRLAGLLGARLVIIEDSATLVPEDQPGVLADAIRDFLTEHECPPTQEGGGPPVRGG